MIASSVGSVYPFVLPEDISNIWRNFVKSWRKSLQLASGGWRLRVQINLQYQHNLPKIQNYSGSQQISVVPKENADLT